MIYLGLVLVGGWDRVAQRKDELLGPDGMLLVVGDERVEGVEEHLLDEEVADGAVLLLSVFDGNVVNLEVKQFVEKSKIAKDVSWHSAGQFVN